MKCLKSIKESRNTEKGSMIRTSEKDAETKVKTGFWMYVSKSEYKAWVKGVTVEELQSIKPETKKQTTSKKK